ncbi:hypothetical protein BWR19_15305 [Halomonas sp. 1513]|nr:hypothetical protein BWR19_15305 [Halomonas sp. 1513]
MPRSAAILESSGKLSDSSALLGSVTEHKKRCDFLLQDSELIGKPVLDLSLLTDDPRALLSDWKVIEFGFKGTKVNHLMPDILFKILDDLFVIKPPSTSDT